MGASCSSEWRSVCCCCYIDSKRRAVEIGDGSLGESLLDESKKGDAIGEGTEDGGRPSKTVVNDAWLLQVEETRREVSEREAHASRRSSDGEEGGDEEDEQHVDERKTAWDLSEEDENAEEERDTGGEEEVDASLATSEDGDDGLLTEGSMSKADGGFWRRSDRFSSRSTKDSYASVTDCPNGSMLFRESIEGASAHNGNAPDDEDAGDAEEHQVDDEDDENVEDDR